MMMTLKKASGYMRGNERGIKCGLIEWETWAKCIIMEAGFVLGAVDKNPRQKQEKRNVKERMK